MPDNITDYRIITIGQTKDSRFAVAEKTVQVRKDYTIESHVPYIVYPGDTFNATATVFNSTNKITNADVIFIFGTGSAQVTKKQPVILQALSATAIDVPVEVSQGWS